MGLMAINKGCEQQIQGPLTGLGHSLHVIAVGISRPLVDPQAPLDQEREGILYLLSRDWKYPTIFDTASFILWG